MNYKFCINCEVEFMPDANNNGDFCSDECTVAFNASADPDTLDRVSKSNPDTLPESSWAKPSQPYNTNSGILPPNSIEAITSMLKTSGISQADIDKASQAIKQAESERK